MIAALYDVHGNLPALDAVLADVEEAGADRIWLGGDYALFGGWPAETIERVRGLKAEVVIRGNVDRWVGRQPPDSEEQQAAVADCREAIGEEATRWLGNLPAGAKDETWTIVHGSPVSDMRSFLPEPSDDDQEMLNGMWHGRLLFGHLHIPFRRIHGEVELVNPGSVGVPLDGDHRPSYALVHDDGRVEHRRVEHDCRSMIARLDEAFPGAIWTDTIKGRLERARMA